MIGLDPVHWTTCKAVVAVSAEPTMSVTAEMGVALLGRGPMQGSLAWLSPTCSGRDEDDMLAIVIQGRCERMLAYRHLIEGAIFGELIDGRGGNAVWAIAVKLGNDSTGLREVRIAISRQIWPEPGGSPK